ncbi:CapA family protein [Candidatus Parcubacteria bacterium]|nr:CapA family protein [Patescibacteria group bacterium]MBU4467040.1 CapA family protein [Patescibacteria group bacterium]MCG2688590.1 CapA family protein [Candidatus Parcubacteria bacterium]
MIIPIKKIFFILLIMLLTLAGFFVFKPRIIELAFKKTPTPEPEKQIELIFVGDIMLDRGVEYMVEKYGQNDFNFPFLNIAEDLKKADLTIANLESQISDQGKDMGSIYSFRAPVKAMNGLLFSGIDIVSLANNHALDYGSQALRDSLARLIDNNIAPIGAGDEFQAFSPTIKTVGQTRIAFFAYTDQLPLSARAKDKNFGVAIINQYNLPRIKQDISLAKQLTDIVVISLHWGVEYAAEPNDSQIALAKELVDAGADLIIGHHPHVIQRYEKYQNSYIFYSLGNFIFDQGFSDETLEGVIVKVIIKDKKIETAFSLKVILNEFFQPELATH